jgi:hypothetical protein
MSNPVNNQSSQSDIAQLKEQFERINQIIENGRTVKIDLTENDRSISLMIDRDNVVKSDLPIKSSPTRKARSRSDKDSLTERSTDTFSFDIGRINSQVKTDDIEAQISRTLDEKTENTPKRKMRSSGSRSGVATLGVPNPVVKYTGETWLLAEDCVYKTTDGFTITAKSGFKTDLASIPRVFWALISSFELSIAAPILHDLIYRSAGEVTIPNGEVEPADKIFTRQEADDIFLELMTRAKVSYWKRNVAYLAVRHFAEGSWRKLGVD